MYSDKIGTRDGVLCWEYTDCDPRKGEGHTPIHLTFGDEAGVWSVQQARKMLTPTQFSQVWQLHLQDKIATRLAKIEELKEEVAAIKKQLRIKNP